MDQYYNKCKRGVLKMEDFYEMLINLRNDFAYEFELINKGSI